MRTIFMLMSTTGFVYIAVLVATREPQIRRRFRRQLDPKRWIEKLESSVFQEILREAGIRIPSQKINLFRLLASLSILTIGYGPALWGKQPGLEPVLTVFLLWFATTPRPYTLGWMFYNQLKKRRINRKNGELVALLKLYENNKRIQNLKFEHFLKHVSNYFQLLKKELITLSERVTDDGLQPALDWFVKQFPESHPFVGQIRTIILATEGKEGEEAAQVLDQESQTISKICNDLYLGRWNTFSTFATVLNALPSFAMFLLIIVLVLYNISLAQSQILR